MSNPAEETPHDKDLEAADIIHETKEIPVETTQSNPVASGTQEIPVASTRAFLIMPNLGDPTQGMPAQRSLTQEIPAVKDPRQQDSPPKNVPSMIIPTVAEVQQYYQAQGQHATASHESVRTERNRKNSRVIQNSLLAMAALAAFFLGLVIFGYIISEPANPEKVTDIPVGTSLLPENSKNCGQGVYAGPDPSGLKGSGTSCEMALIVAKQYRISPMDILWSVPGPYGGSFDFECSKGREFTRCRSGMMNDVYIQKA